VRSDGTGQEPIYTITNSHTFAEAISTDGKYLALVTGFAARRTLRPNSGLWLIL